jgi:hypothetical protein
VTSTNLPGGAVAAWCVMTLADELFWAFATQQPGRIAAKPNAPNRDKICCLILT